MTTLAFSFSAELWVWEGKAAWHFVTLPEERAQQIRFYQHHRRGFGAVKVQARLGNSTWSTSIFPDKRSGSYLLPVKAEIREQEKLQAGHAVQIQLSVSAAL